MKRIIITAAVSIALGLAAGWLIFKPAPMPTSSERKIKFYRDPMNPAITSPTPKKSSDGMDFVPVYEEPTGGQKKIAYYRDPMHPWFTSDKPGKAPDCGMDLVPVYEGEAATQGIKIDPTVIQNIGVKVETVERRTLSKVIRTVGKVDFDETKVYSINTKIMGWVEHLFVDYTGMVVKKGDPLMELYSPELVSTQEEFLQAIRYRKQLEQSSIEEARKGADRLVESAKRRLLNWDIPEKEIHDLEERGIPKKTLTIYSLVDGIVMDKMVFKGKNVMAGMDLYKIADLSTVWIQADIYQYELPWVKIGDRAEIELSYLPGKTFHGVINYIYPTLNMDTKTVKVRIAVKNTSTFEFKPEMYATVQITSPVVVHAVVVPDQAVIRSGERNVVVISLGGGYFDPREVKLGMTSEGYDQILEGVREGENIVVSSQFLIDSESNLRAAISQMSGHPGTAPLPSGDASKPTEKQVSPRHQGHNMDAMPAEPSSHGPAQAKKGKATKHKKLEPMDDMPMEGMDHDADSTAHKSPESEKVADKKILDPVCGMEAIVDDEHAFVYKDKKYYFCSQEDRDQFKQDPAKYTGMSN